MDRGNHFIPRYMIMNLPPPVPPPRPTHAFLPHYLLVQEPPTPGRGPPPPVPGQFENPSDGRRTGRFAPPAPDGVAGIVGGVDEARPGTESGMNFAERMMAKMGHREGQGGDVIRGGGGY